MLFECRSCARHE
ncbi:BgTH12-01147 [Blumeria graminis f. sp. triticale]|uniref:BgTH12-01147 n=1 Tax=Blumeria graminis f. sp. triticale TaxID=1689686 RepID=A0A9W4GHI3_BLUGR|nr:BgTH12-01147 [Blumeria graminis f. sp. triticale]